MDRWDCSDRFAKGFQIRMCIPVVHSFGRMAREELADFLGYTCVGHSGIE